MADKRRMLQCGALVVCCMLDGCDTSGSVAICLTACFVHECHDDLTYGQLIVSCQQLRGCVTAAGGSSNMLAPQAGPTYGSALLAAAQALSSPSVALASMGMNILQ
jgi:hypothetical protein